MLPRKVTFWSLNTEEGHPEDVTAGLTCDWIQAMGNSPLLPPLGMCALLAFPSLEAAQGHSLEMAMC